MSATAVLRKNDWCVVPVPDQATVLAFLRTHHYAKGGSKASLYRHGLYRRDLWPLVGEVMGVASWLPPLPGVAETVGPPNGVLVLSRLCVHPDAPKNGASFLLGQSMRLIDRRRWPVLLTYADTALGHTGAIYKATNWRCVGESVHAGDVWVNADGLQRGRKRGNSTLSSRRDATAWLHTKAGCSQAQVRTRGCRMTGECSICGGTFTVRSIASRNYVCPDCRKARTLDQERIRARSCPACSGEMFWSDAQQTWCHVESTDCVPDPWPS